MSEQPRTEAGCEIDGSETLSDWAMRLADERVEAIVEPHELAHARHRREELRAAIEREDAARPLDVEAWAREIVLHDDQHHDTDHACAECIPDGEIVVPGFRCVPHEARACLAALSQPGGSDAE